MGNRGINLRRSTCEVERNTDSSVLEAKERKGLQREEQPL